MNDLHPEGQTARCVECGLVKSLQLFHRERSRPNGRNRRCKECRNARNREHVANNRQRRMESMARWRAENPDRYAAAQRAYKLKGYGLSPEAYEALLLAQGGVCAICCRPARSGWDLSVDHDHESKAVRGLLCGQCNAGIGLLRDDGAVLESALRYLQKPPAPEVLEKILGQAVDLRHRRSWTG
ncbi:MAG: hypothetical protein EPN99_07245 [Frankiales bacterium]|nr:MAG: hypothetical protein EPN99_07245 [Frankiales bacterium]